MPTTQTPETEEHALPAAKEQKLLPASAGSTTAAAKRSGGPWRMIVLILVLLAAGVFTYFRIRGNKKEQADTAQKAVQAANKPVPVTVSAVASRTMPIYLTALGTVTAYNTVTVKSRVDGQLLSVNVKEGQQVSMGQTIAQIDPRPYQAVEAQAEGQLAKDLAAAEFSKSEAARYTSLFEAGVISKESEQTQVSNANQSVGTEAADRAAIQAAKVNVAYTRITSPINGVVGLRQVDAGNIVHAADTTGLIVVTQLQPIAVIFTLPEDQLQQVLKLVRAGHKLVVEAFDRSETTHLGSGTLLTVDNQIDTTTGTVKVKAVFDNKDGALFPNQFVNVRLILDERQNSLVIPAAALQTGTNGSFVYVVKPGDPPAHKSDNPGRPIDGVKKPAAGDAAQSGQAQDGQAQDKGPHYWVDVANVDVDLTEGSSVILKGGVKAGDLVVIDGEEKLKRYGRVKPQQGKSNAGGPSTQQIGAAGGGSSATAEPSSPDQGAPEPGSKQATPDRTSARPNQGQPKSGSGKRAGAGSAPGAGGPQ